MGSFLIQPTRRGYRMKCALILLVCLGTAHCFWITGLNRQDEGEMMPLEEGDDMEGPPPMEEGEKGKGCKKGGKGDEEERKGGKGGKCKGEKPEGEKPEGEKPEGEKPEERQEEEQEGGDEKPSKDDGDGKKKKKGCK